MASGYALIPYAGLEFHATPWAAPSIRDEDTLLSLYENLRGTSFTTVTFNRSGIRGPFIASLGELVEIKGHLYTNSIKGYGATPVQALRSALEKVPT